MPDSNQTISKSLKDKMIEVMNLEIANVEDYPGNPGTYKATLVDGTVAIVQVLSITSNEEEKAKIQAEIDKKNAELTELMGKLNELNTVATVDTIVDEVVPK